MRTPIANHRRELPEKVGILLRCLASCISAGGTTAASVMLLLSFFRAIECRRDGRRTTVVLYCTNGIVEARYFPSLFGVVDWSMRSGVVQDKSVMAWLPEWRLPRGGVGGATLPLWIPVVCFGSTSWMLYIGRDRTRLESCRCGYSLAGIAQDVPCPECGACRPPPMAASK